MQLAATELDITDLDSSRLKKQENKQIQISQKYDGQESQVDTEGRPEVYLYIHKFTI